MAFNFFDRVWMTGGVYYADDGNGYPYVQFNSDTPAKAGYVAPSVLANTSILVKKDDDNWHVVPFASFDRYAGNMFKYHVASNASLDGYSYDPLYPGYYYTHGILADGDVVEVLVVPTALSLAAYASAGLFKRDFPNNVVIPNNAGCTFYDTNAGNYNSTLPAIEEYKFIGTTFSYVIPASDISVTFGFASGDTTTLINGAHTPLTITGPKKVTATLLNGGLNSTKWFVG